MNSLQKTASLCGYAIIVVLLLLFVYFSFSNLYNSFSIGELKLRGSFIRYNDNPVSFTIMFGIVSLIPCATIGVLISLVLKSDKPSPKA